MRVLILGGYGVFGSRLARLLADDRRCTLIIAGRSARKAQALCRELGGTCEAVAVDRDGDLAPAFAAVGADVVVDASGPFQNYGARPYRVVEASVAARAHYLDLADDAAFVTGVSAHDAVAKAAGRAVLSGVSSFPVLTAAAVRALDLDSVETIEVGLAPSPKARLGLGVVRALVSYAGRPITVWRGGRETTARALMETRRLTVGPPGGLPLPSLRFALVETPDLRLLPQLWPEAREVWVGLGARPQLLQRMLQALAFLRAPLPLLAPLLHRASHALGFGEHRSGMFVRVRGAAAGVGVLREWHLTAEGDDGPFIPAMPCAALITRLLEGGALAAGARPATRELELAELQPWFARRRIRAGVREEPPVDAPLYRCVLGAAWEALPAPIRDLHSVDAERRFAGLAEVDRGRGPFAPLAAWMFGFPPPGRDVPVEVILRLEGTVERWTRVFGGRRFSSAQRAGTGRADKLLMERFGPFSVALAAVVEEGRLRLVVRGWSVLGLPLPSVLAPRGDTYEAAEDGRFHFHVEIRLPLVGLIVAYRGWLEPL